MADDPFAMYYVVRKDVPLSFGQSMAIAGAAAVRCADAFAADPRFADALAAWGERPRKVALRAGAEEIELVRSQLPCAVDGDTLLCLPPMRKSERTPLLAELRPFTDAPRPAEPPEPAREPLVYAIRPGVIKTMGKAMAQAGHAALGAAAAFDLAGWREHGMPGEVRAATDAAWERLRGAPDAVVVTDAGHTQVEPGTETVIALAPGSVLDGLSRIP